MLRFRMPIVVIVAFALALAGAVAVLAQQGGEKPAVESLGKITNRQYNSVVAPYGDRVVKVDITNFAFQPTEIVVTPGTLVVWTNQDSVQHNVVIQASEQNGLDAPVSGPMLNRGENYGLVFHKVGVYNYTCAPHPFMNAVVRVVAPEEGA